MWVGLPQKRRFCLAVVHPVLFQRWLLVSGWNEWMTAIVGRGRARPVVIAATWLRPVRPGPAPPPVPVGLAAGVPAHTHQFGLGGSLVLSAGNFEDRVDVKLLLSFCQDARCTPALLSGPARVPPVVGPATGSPGPGGGPGPGHALE